MRLYVKELMSLKIWVWEIFQTYVLRLFKVHDSFMTWKISGMIIKIDK